jgi:hypothetical protein
VPLATLVCFECGMRWRMKPTYWRGIPREFDLGLYLVGSILSIAVYFPLIAWVSFLIGLRVRTHARAIMAATATLVVWCAAPIFLVTIPLEILFGHPGRMDREFINCSTLLSPAMIIPANEFSELPEFGNPWLAVCSNFLVYGALALLFRAMSLDNADRWLGRSSDLDFTGSRSAPAAAASLDT